MSGGYFNYENNHIAYEMDGKWQDEELNALFGDLFVEEVGNTGYNVAQALDYWRSGDIGEWKYRQVVDAFKKRWFGRIDDDRAKFYCDALQRRFDELKAEIVGCIEKAESE